MDEVGFLEPVRYDYQIADGHWSRLKPMSQPLLVSIPHRLDRLEARSRLDSGIGRLRSIAETEPAARWQSPDSAGGTCYGPRDSIRSESPVE